jgi:long-chain acyl-CoA synthetase
MVNYVVRNVKKMVPALRLPGAVRFNDAVAKGTRGTLKSLIDQARRCGVLQYTGGTTGVSKGAVLLHRNLVANVLQSEAWNEPGDEDHSRGRAAHQRLRFAAVPHLRLHGEHDAVHAHGRQAILIPNPRDLPAVLKELSKHTIPQLSGGQHLVQRLANHPDFNTVDWSNLKVSVGGGTAVQSAVAKLWLEKTGCPICEGYGLRNLARRPAATR